MSKRPKKPGSPARFKGRERGPSTLKQRDIARTLRAAKQVGGVARVEVTRDGISVILGNPTAPIGNELDQWMAKKNAHETKGH
jgi:hypothetical protein